MSKGDAIQLEGLVTDTMPNAFKVKLENGHEIRAVLGGKLRMNHIRVLPGDRVTIEISPYDLNNGRITYRHR
ncbi:MAG: translation initiation factor IF-1 [Solobacterium sp.]|nr:translation initiation factor IF-1 [Solobacterium sp.]